MEKIDSVYFCEIGGLVGEMTSGGKIESCYFSGNYQGSENVFFDPVSHAMGKSILNNIYYTSSGDYSYPPTKCEEPKVYFISDNDLKSGEKIVGLEDFIFEINNYPYI